MSACCRAALALVALLALGGCARAPREESVAALPVRYAVASDAVTLDPRRASDNLSRDLSRLLGDGLVGIDERLDVVPRVARSFEWSPDHLTLTFRLRDDARFSDGALVTARDVVHTYETYTRPDAAVSDIKHAFDFVESVDAVAPLEVRVRYRRPFAPAIFAWTVPLLPERATAADPPPGCGPFVVDRWDRGQRLIFRANPDYYDGPPAAPQIEFEVLGDYATRFAALEAGRIDATSLSPVQWRDAVSDPSFAERFEIREFQMLFVFYIAWRGDGSNPYFADPRVRRAMTAAIDRETYIGTIAHGYGRVGATLFHPGHFSFDPGVAPWPYDPERARALLADAGWIDRDGDGVVDRGGRPFRFRLTYAQSSKESERIAAYVQAQLKAVGVAVELDPVEWAVYLERVAQRRFEALMNGRHLDPDPDPYDLWHSSQANVGANYPGLTDPEIDRLVEEGRETFDRDERSRAYHAMQARLHELEPATVLFYPLSKLAMSREVRGLAVSPVGVLGFWPGPAAWRREPVRGQP